MYHYPPIFQEYDFNNFIIIIIKNALFYCILLIIFNMEVECNT